GGFEAGDTVSVRLFWRAEAAIERDYTVFVHLVGPDGELVAQRDQQPLGGFFPTSYWSPGRVVPDEYQLVLPPDAPPGMYDLRVGMYDLESGRRLAVTREGEPAADAVRLAPLQVGLAS
ncbi:MAG TPA: hypothetical protein VER55_08920, partial [Ardenticatenaceae bacterium]|nr:hypothetical protein [Ardenticatenaceae bacterium]